MRGTTGNSEFMAVYRSWYLYSHKLALRVCLPLCITADDITQEVWIRLWTRRHELSQVENMAAYIKRCIVFAIQNHHRNENARAARNEANTAFQYCEPQAADEPVLRQERDYALAGAIESLPVKRREIVRMRMQNYSSVEIATALDLSQKTVQNQLLNSIPLMRAYLERRCMLN
jgi:RNA polymerase sigma-70 factor (ECF subfamily)